LIDCEEDGMEEDEMAKLFALYHSANKSMRTWTHGIKNQLSEKIN
jgi:hypothetical protein